MSRILPVLLLGGCSVGVVDVPIDYDGDGLFDEEEAQYGTSPDYADTDADNYNDDVEILSFTDPLDPDDHPYTGGWPIGACRHDIEGSGYGVGFIAPQFELEDQFEELVKLHDFCEHAVLLTAFSYG